MSQNFIGTDMLISRLADTLQEQDIRPVSRQQAELFLAENSPELNKVATWVVKKQRQLGMKELLRRLGTHQKAQESAVREALQLLSNQLLSQAPAALTRV